MQNQTPTVLAKIYLFDKAVCHKALIVYTSKAQEMMIILHEIVVGEIL